MTPPKYTNPKPPEGISSGHEHPLADVAKSSLVVFVVCAVLLAVLFGGARLLAPHVPFAWEKAAVDRLLTPALVTPARDAEPRDADPADPVRQDYLRALATRVAAAMALPPEMRVTVHYVQDDAVNAFATLGGHIFVYRGLWRVLDSENAAAMLLAHEIAHVANRDPIRGLSGALAASLAGALLLGDTSVFGDLAGAATLLAALHFSREQEDAADAAAVRAVVAMYGHLNGATDLFAGLQAAAKDIARPPEFLATHPELADRIAGIERRAAASGWKLRGEKSPLP